MDKSESKDFLKNSVLEAEKIKQTAIANAKVALAEQFSSDFRASLATKLEEMDNSDEDLYEGEDIEDILQEEEEAEEGEVETETEEEETEEEEAEELASDEAEIDLEDMTDEELRAVIEDVIADMIDTGELMPGGEETEMELDVDAEEDEEVDMDVDMEIEDEEVESAESEDKEDLKESEEVEEAEINEFDRYGSGTISDENELIKAIEKLAAKSKPFLKKVADVLAAAGEGAGAAIRSEAEDELEEAMATIGKLNENLQSVNLLNAKLQHSLKFFQAYELSENTKYEILESLDKAESVREVKIIFESLEKGFGKKESKVRGRQISENLKLGGASKSIVTESKTKENIIPVDSAVARMQKLAGIK